VDSIALPFCRHDLDECSSHIFPVLLSASELRPTFMSYMKESGIQTSIHYPPIHKFSAYNHKEHNGLTITEDVCSREVTLPLFPAMNAEQVENISRAVRDNLHE